MGGKKEEVWGQDKDKEWRHRLFSHQITPDVSGLWFVIKALNYFKRTELKKKKNDWNDSLISFVLAPTRANLFQF